MNFDLFHKISRRGVLRITVILGVLYAAIVLLPNVLSLFRPVPSDVGVSLQSFNSLWVTQYPDECDTPYWGGLELGVWNPRDRTYLVKSNGSPISIRLKGDNNAVRASLLAPGQAPSLEQSILAMDASTMMTLTAASIQVDLGNSANLTLTERMCVPSLGYMPRDGTWIVVLTYLDESNDVWSSTRTEHYVAHDQTMVITLTDTVINKRHLDQAVLRFSSIANSQGGEVAIESHGKNLDISLPTGIEENNKDSRIELLASFYAREIELFNPIGALELDYHEHAINLDGMESALGSRNLHLGPQESSEPFEVIPPGMYRRESSNWSIIGYTTSVTYGNVQFIKPPWENLAPEVQVFFLSIPVAILGWLASRLWSGGQHLAEKRPPRGEETTADPPTGYFVIALSSGRIVAGILSAKPTFRHKRYVLKNARHKDENGAWREIAAPEITVDTSQVDYSYLVRENPSRMI